MKISKIVLLTLVFPFLISISFAQVQQDWLARTDSVTAENIVIDRTGNVYVSGTIFRGTSGFNICLLKYNSNGTQLWQKEFNGIGDEADGALAMALDTSGNIFVTGYSFRGPTLLNYEIVTIKYTPDGDSLWVRRYNSPNARDDRGFAIAIDSSGNAYVGGYINNISLSNVYGQDYITIKYSPEGVQLWASILDLNEACIKAMVTDTHGNVYVTGLGVGTTSTTMDYITVKYNANGNIVWESRMNGPEVDEGKDIALDDSGYVYVTGSSQAGGWYDFITVKYDTIGESVWIKRFDGPVNEDDKAVGLVVDKEQNVYVTGEVSVVQGLSYLRDFATVKYNKDGGTSWVKYYNGPGNSVDIPEDITIDTTGNIYITGGSIGTGFSGYPDYATIRYNPNGDLTWLQRYNAAEQEDKPQAISVDLSGNVYISGNSMDSSYVDGSVTIKYSQSIAPATFPLSVFVSNGWNLVSIPGLHPVNQNTGTWWAGKDPNAGVFKFLGGYEAIISAVPGTGYWMKHVGANTYNTGDEWPASGIITVDHDPIPGAAGWNLFGAYEESVSTSGITTTPPGLQTGSVFQYSVGTYQIAATLDPGIGYWVKLSGPGLINIPTGADDPIRSKVLSTDNLGKITITDNARQSYSLYAADSKVDLSQFDLPPYPPRGIFDIRYSSQRYAENISTPQSVDMMGVQYPVKIKAEGIGIILSDETGKEIARLKAGEEITLDGIVGKLMVSGNIIPSVYSLEQNYPNPFNPGTTIQFSIPEDVQNVKLIVYNALGEKAAELVNTGLTAGTYKYKWDTGSVASGMYIYQVVTEKFVSTKKMILLK